MGLESGLPAPFLAVKLFSVCRCNHWARAITIAKSLEIAHVKCTFHRLKVTSIEVHNPTSSCFIAEFPPPTSLLSSLLPFSLHSSYLSILPPLHLPPFLSSPPSSLPPLSHSVPPSSPPPSPLKDIARLSGSKLHTRVVYNTLTH